jgi:hypothetical protein
MESIEAETLQAIERPQRCPNTVLEYTRMLEMAKAKGGNDEAARVKKVFRHFGKPAQNFVR